ncbi:MAG: type II secretion system minor pseudopilin GspK [Sphingomonas sp.]
MRVRASERGAALLTVLLLVAVISVLAASALEKLRLSTRLAENGTAVEQARAFAYAAETVAVIRVNTLLSINAAKTTLQGDWAGHPYALPVPGGTATLTVNDGGNCFNLNALVDETVPGTYVAAQERVQEFVRLMKLLGIPGQVADGVAQASADWIDSDDQPLPLGAEDTAYLGKDNPYRTANTLMTDPSELRAVAGVTPELYDQLRPWVCALPTTKMTINANTLQPEQAPLFAMLFPDGVMDAGRARALIQKRPMEGYDSTSDFWNQASLDGGKTALQAQKDQVVLTTYWFRMTIDVTADGVQLTQTDLIDATRGHAQIVSRAWEDAA